MQARAPGVTVVHEVQPIEERIPDNTYNRSLRITQHAIDKLLERTKDIAIDWSEATGVPALGHALDLLIVEARERGDIGDYTEVDRDHGGDRAVKIAKLDLGAGRAPVYALIVNNDTAGKYEYAVVTLLDEGKYRASMRSQRYKPVPTRLTSVGDAIVEAAAAHVAERDTKPDSRPVHIAPLIDKVLAGVRVVDEERHGSGEATDALVVYNPGSNTISCAWAEVAQRVAELVDKGVEIEAISTYRRVPLKVRRSITVTLGD